ncbi:MAG: DUF456 domain-containing protein [Phycisphaerales bacterium]|nr:DUF456 domain-containing protein [Phycisphaerales bacterium]
MEYLAATIVALVSLIGVAMTLLSFPGIWTMVLVALLCKWWQPEMFSWWTLGIALACAGLAEIVETFASAAGAAKAKGSKTAMFASLVGAIAGAILGTVFLPFLPIIGTIIGGIAGAGLAAGAAERGIKRKEWRDSWNVAKGAAAGRAVSIVVKGAIAVGVALLLSISAFWP